MDDTELSKRLWTVADAIVAFVVLQEVAFAILVIQRDSALPGLESWTHRLLASGLLAVAYAAYAWAAWWVGNRSVILVGPGDTRKQTMQRMNWGRAVVIVFFGVMTILLVFWDHVAPVKKAPPPATEQHSRQQDGKEEKR